MFAQDYIKLRLLFASGFTLALLIIFLSIPLIGVAFLSTELSWIELIIILIISSIFNFIIFILSPLLMDLVLKSQYRKVDWTTSSYIQDSHPLSHFYIKKICRKYKISEPRIAVVNDKTPFAFTFGNFPCNARIVISNELLTFLRDEELAAVYAHELGHIVRYDFAVMTLAQTLVICFYWFAQVLWRSNGGSSWVVTKTFSFLSLLFYYIGFFLSLYLSRVREFSADYFAVENIENPSALSTALAKIAYEMILAERPNTLTESARALNIFDLSVNRLAPSKEDQEIQKLMWDLFDSSGRWNEIRSTHPFPAKRITAISNYSKRRGVHFELNLLEIISECKEFRRKRGDFDNYESRLEADSSYQIESGSLKIMIRYNKALLIILFIFSLMSLFGGIAFPILMIIGIINYNPIWASSSVTIIFIGCGIYLTVVALKLNSSNPGYLLLTPSGLEINYPFYLFHKIFFRWSEIEDIQVFRYKYVKHIGFNFSNTYMGRRRGILCLLNKIYTKIYTGYDFTVRSYYEKDPEELCYILQRWKNFYS